MSKIEVNQISSQCGSTLTIGQSGDTVTLAAGATAAGFGSTGEVSWDTTKKTTGFTATSGVGYFCDTTSAAFTVTLPATPSAGNVVAVSDYTGTFATNNLTIGRNGSNINGAASDFVIFQDSTTAQFIYVDATEGWRLVFTGANSNLISNFIVATGGTITCCGDYKIHTFTGPGTFTVSSAGTPSGSTTIDYLVVAGGGGGGQNTPFGGYGAGAGGAGGYRASGYGPAPLQGSAITATASSYPITVGAGGAGSPCAPGFRQGCSGSNSVFSTITSTGGGGGGSGNDGLGVEDGLPGGSGGGSGEDGTGGTGNTPPVSPPQGFPGGSQNCQAGGSGGGGATAAGGNGTANGGAGGAGAPNNITGTAVTYAGGGGGGGGCSGSGGSGGAGGGGSGGVPGGSPAPTSGTANTGGGGGGGTANPGHTGGSGGSGIVIIRYKYQ